MNFLTRLFKRKRKLYTFTPDYTVRPSQSILEAMEFANVSVRDFWGKSDLNSHDIAFMLADEEPIGKHVAVELSKVLGSSPEFWFNLSKAYHDKKGCKNA